MNTEIPDVKAIFYEALQRTEPCAREAYLVDACRGNATLRAEVESLLRFHDRIGGLLPSPDLLLEGAPEDAHVTEGPGTVIGRYKLLEKIGEGGWPWSTWPNSRSRSAARWPSRSSNWAWIPAR
jgi:hypothetical protein